MQAVFDVLGLGRRDVSSSVPPAIVAERLTAYRRAHPGQESLRLLAFNPGSGEMLASALASSVLAAQDDDDDEVGQPPARVEIVAFNRRRSLTDPLPALTELQAEVAVRQVQGSRSYLTPLLGLSVRPAEHLSLETSAAHLGVLADLARISATGRSELPSVVSSFHNLLTPTTNLRLAASEGIEWQTSAALRSRRGIGAAEAVDAHRSYSAALAAQLGGGTGTAVTAALRDGEQATLRAAHDRADWVLTLDRHLGIDLFTASGPTDETYILDYAPDFLEGLGPRLTVTTAHRKEVQRLLADAMGELHLAAVDESVRAILHHLQVVSGRLALRLIGRSTLATEAVSLAALMAYLDARGDLRDTIVVPVDAHLDVFGDAVAGGVQRCDVLLVRITARTMRMECVEVKSRRAAVLPAQLADEIVDQLDATEDMLRSTFFRTDPARIDADLQRARLVGILRHHAERAVAMGLLGPARRAEAERLFERLEDGQLVPEFPKTGYLVSLGDEPDVPREHRGVPIHVVTAADLGPAGLASIVGSLPDPGWGPDPEPSIDPDPDPGPDTDPGPGPEPVPEPAPDPGPGALGSVDPVGPARAEEASPSASPLSSGFDRPTPVDEPVETTAVVGSKTDPAARQEPAGDRAAVIDVHLGQDGNAADVRWRISTSGSPHMFVLGIPGQGKSVTTRRVLDSFAEQGLPALVLDFHGDMAADPAGGAAVLDAAEGLALSPFELRDNDHTRHAEAAWELSEVIGYVCDLGEIQQNVVYEAVRDLYRKHGFGSIGGPVSLPTMTELADAVAERERGGRGRNVAARLRPLTDFGLFVDRPDELGFADLLRSGVVLDVHGLMEQVQLAAGAFVLRKVYREMFQWGQTAQLRLAVVLDEAHRLARDVTLPKIMKEGRKYGVAVVVASQGVDDFHRDVLGNAGTKVVFRCNFPQSKKVAGFLRGRTGQDMSTALENLGVGQAFVSTPERAEARKVFMSR